MRSAAKENPAGSIPNRRPPDDGGCFPVKVFNISVLAESIVHNTLAEVALHILAVLLGTHARQNHLASGTSKGKGSDQEGSNRCSVHGFVYHKGEIKEPTPSRPSERPNPPHSPIASRNTLSQHQIVSFSTPAR